jgi:hypothetical protein
MVAPASAARVALLVSLTAIPTRVPTLGVVLDHLLLKQARPPDRTLLVVPAAFRRFANRSIDAAASVSGRAVDTLVCDEDFGPATKLLGSLRWAHRHAPAGARTYLVLVDDDVTFAPWALREVEAAARHDGSRAYSFFAYLLARSDLCVGQGADAFALPLAALGDVDGVLRSWRRATALESAFWWHDDVWLSMLLHDELGVRVCPALPKLAPGHLDRRGVAASQRGALKHSTPDGRTGARMDRASLNRRLARAREALLPPRPRGRAQRAAPPTEDPCRQRNESALGNGARHAVRRADAGIGLYAGCWAAAPFRIG